MTIDTASAKIIAQAALKVATDEEVRKKVKHETFDCPRFFYIQKDFSR